MRRSRDDQRPCPVDLSGESRTKQAQAADADINRIMARYVKTGYLPLTGREPLYADVSGVADYHASLNKVLAAEDAFAAMPSSIRDACGNDPGRFLELAMNPELREEAIAAGILERPKGAPSAGAGAEPQVSQAASVAPPGRPSSHPPADQAGSTPLKASGSPEA